MRILLLYSNICNFKSKFAACIDDGNDIIGAFHYRHINEIDFKTLSPDVIIFDLCSFHPNTSFLKQVSGSASAPVICIAANIISDLSLEDYFYSILYEPILHCELMLSIKLAIQRYKFHTAIINAKNEWMQIFDSMPDLMMVLDKNNNIIKANKAVSKLYGLEPADIIGKRCFDLLHKDCRELSDNCPYKSAICTQAVQRETIYYNEPLNQWHLVTVAPLYDKEGTCTSYVHYSKDITKQKLIETELKNSEAQLKAIIQNRSHSIWAVDRNYKLILFNEFYKQRCKIRFGFDISLGLNHLELLTNTDYRYKYELAYNSAFCATSSVIEYSYKIYNSDQYIEAHINPIIIDHEIIGASVFAFDITERKILHDIIKESENKFRDIFKKNTAIMLLVNPKTCEIIDANEAASAFYGYKLSKLIGMKISDLSTNDPSQCIEKIQNLSENNTSSCKVEHRLADGTIKNMEIYVSKIYVKGTEMLFSILHDITDKIKFERELTELNKMLAKKIEEEVSKRRAQEQLLIQQSKMAAMGEMLAVIAHQWKQPLNALSLIIQSLNAEVQSPQLDKDFFQDMTTKAQQQITYMSNTIEDFRNFFRPSKSKQLFDVKSAVCRVVDLMSPHFENSGIDIAIADNLTDGYEEICVYGRGNNTLTVLGYENEFKQAIMAILQNAKDAIDERRLQGKFNYKKGLIKVAFSAQNNKIVITIADNAGGIPPEFIDKIFDHYFTTKKDNKGTGIGLYMAKTIIENNMNGILTVQNNEEGAVFKITL